MIRTVYCGIDPRQFFPVDANRRDSVATALGFLPQFRRLLFIGALGNDRKGFPVVFDVWRKLAESWTDFELIVVGIGRTLARWRQAAENAHLSQRLRFLGHRDDVPAILKSSDLLIAPATYEPYGLNIVEALSCGLPAIASRGSGASERISGALERLLLTEPTSRAELLAKLLLWRDSSNDFRQAALASAERLRSYSWESMSHAIHSAIEDAYT